MRLLLPLVAATAAGMEFGTDQPGRWYDPDISHHSHHGAGGVVIGAVGYLATGLTPLERPGRYACTVAGAYAVGYSYELWMGRDGQSLVDPVDAAWVAGGALVGAGLADLTEGLVSIVTHKDSVAVGVTMSW